MDAFEVLFALRDNGYTITEADLLLRYIAEEHQLPTSRTKATRLHKAEEALRAIGIDPATVEFPDGWPGA